MATVSFVAAYSLQPGTTSVGMVDPGGGQIGDMHVLVVGSKNPTDGVPTADNGFLLVGSGVVGTGADGAGVGQIRISVFAREQDATGSLGTTTISNGATNVLQGGGAIWRRDTPGSYWRLTPVFGSDTDGSSTAFSATVASILNANGGDMLYAASFLTANTTLPGRGLTTTGLTGTLTGIDSGGTANGNDVFIWTDRFAITGGALSAATATTGTTGANTTGGTVHVLVEAVAAGGGMPDEKYVGAIPAELFQPPPEQQRDGYPIWQPDGYNQTSWAATSGTTKNLLIPATAKVGHLAIIVVGVNGNASNDLAVSSPGTWVQKYETTLTGWGDTFADQAVFYHTIAAGEPGTNAVISIPGQPRGGASIHTFDNAITDGSDPFEDPQFNESSSSGQPATLNVTSTVKGLLISTITYDTITITAWLPGWNRLHTTPVTTDAAHVAILDYVDPGVTAVQWQLSATNRNNPWAALLKVRPAVGGDITLSLLEAAEIDVATNLTATEDFTLLAAAETDVAESMTVAKTFTLGVATETDVATALTATEAFTLTSASESDVATPLVATEARTLTAATETDVAEVLTATEARTLTTASEVDVAGPLTASEARTLPTAAETDSAGTLSISGDKVIVTAVETDVATPLTATEPRTLTGATETDVATGLTATEARTLTTAAESDVAVPLAAVETRALVTAAETDAAGVLSRLKAFTLPTAVEVDLAASLFAIVGIPKDTTVTVGPPRVGSVTVGGPRTGTVTIAGPRTGSVATGGPRMGSVDVGDTRTERGPH